MTSKLPIFEEYFVDVRLKQFRKVSEQQIIFIDFDSVEGDEILTRYIESLDIDSEEFKRLIHYL